MPLNDVPSGHSGFDPESGKALKIRDSGFRWPRDGAAEAAFRQGRELGGCFPDSSCASQDTARRRKLWEASPGA